ncbi:MAG: P27 family phage terminase small subunit [Prevotella sp.]|nr:P27 family phage terminase small subunit [Prevotella sp.]
MKIKNIVLPDGLKDLTYKFMKGIINTFDREKKLNSLDALSLYLLAGNVNTYLECEEQIAKNGLVSISDRGNESLSSYAVLQKQVQSTIITILKEMGLTLHSRSKITLNETSDLSEIPFLKLLSK